LVDLMMKKALLRIGTPAMLASRKRSTKFIAAKLRSCARGLVGKHHQRNQLEAPALLPLQRVLRLQVETAWFETK
jgi:hypothetical protein